jgi:hypothetical protein
MTMLTGDTTATSPALTPVGAADQAIADKLYGSEPAKTYIPSLQEVRAADPARVLYPPEKQMGREAAAVAVAVFPEATSAQLKATETDIATAAMDLGMSKSDIEQFATYAQANMVKPLTADEQRSHKLAAIKDLRNTYGDNYDEALKAADALMSRDPKFATLVAKADMKNNPWLLLRLADLARVAKPSASSTRKQ